jgi:surface polysaccharide O-acyltransferase-like enzyme
LQPKRLDVNFNVDIIRTLAIVLVVLLHTSDFPYKFINNTITGLDVSNWFVTDIYAAFGYLGVPIFVMLTGALLLTPEKADESARVFFKKRFARIGLPLIFWTIAYFAWDFFYNTSNHPSQPITPFNIGQGLLSGSYPIMWYLYLLAGLYAVTPILRILVKNIKRRLFTYMLVLWFIGSTATPFIQTFTKFQFNPDVFIFTNWVGYFMLGIYLLKTKIRRSRAFLIMLGGLLGAILGDWWVTANYGEANTGFFHHYMSVSAILASLGLLLLLISISPRKLEGHGKVKSVVKNVIHWISENTLPIYLLHIMILESIVPYIMNYAPLTGNQIIDVPMWAFTTFAITVAFVYPLKKIPYISKLIG